jgi:hypothetical protein
MHSPSMERTLLRLVQSILLASTFAALLSHCAKGSNELQVNPPLPPAEEPSDDVKGAYAADAGAPKP